MNRFLNIKVFSEVSLNLLDMGACETPIAFAALVIEGYMEVSFVFKSKTLRDVPLSILIFNLIDSERKDLPNLAKVIKALVYLLCVFPKTSSEG